MATIAAPGPVTAGDEQFWFLVCSDADLLRQEFDAIITAERPASPRPIARTTTTFDPPGRPCRPGAEVVTRLATRPRHPGIAAWGRQRSPPAAAH
jgi:hypothetical protein